MDSTRMKNHSARRPRGGPHPFDTDAEVLKFAKVFLRERAWGFKKDLDICLTAKANKRNKRDHAYMPGLLLCMSFLDLLSGLYAGEIRHHGLDHFLAYTRTFMPGGRYDDDHLRLLYVEFRHKIAHLSHPYFIVDTSKDKRVAGPSRRIAWTICAAPRQPPIELIRLSGAANISSQPTPWPVPYDHRIKISITSLARDARKSLDGPNGYIAALAASADVQQNFRKCMKSFYPA